MKPVTRNQLLIGDALVTLQTLPPDAVDCIVTSPPYFALRDYGVPGQLGAEADVQQWVDGLRRVVQELARVLRPTGSLWLNLGDAYSRGDRWGAPAKSLLLGPERLLLALAEDGWQVRNKIIWAKTNPMPTSVGDRLAMTWEPIYLLTRARRYFFDLDAVRVPHRSRFKPRGRRIAPPGEVPDWAGPLAGDQAGLDRMKAAGMNGHPLGKNPGDVWQVATSNYRGAHFATFPEALVVPAITAGCPPWTCTACQAPWQRQQARRLGKLAVIGALRPSCTCHAPRQPGLVLDPFMGAGTVAVVAERLHRDWLGIELNPAFADLTWQRLTAARAAQVTNRKEVRDA